jgi:flagellin
MAEEESPVMDARGQSFVSGRMRMIINHNMSAIFADRQLKVNTGSLDKSMEKLSSGLRIVRAGDDASGLAVSEKMRSQIRGLR